MTSSPLTIAGQALYGPQWQSALARDLGISDRTMRRWVAGAVPPESIWPELRALLTRRQIKIGGILKEFTTPLI